MVNITKNLYDPNVEKKGELKFLNMLFATIPPDYIQKINNTSKEMIDEIVNHMENIKELGELDKYLIINIQYKKD